MLKPKFYTSILLFISSYSPLFAMLIIKDYNFSFYRFENKIISVVTIILILLSNAILFISLRSSKEAQTEVRVINSDPKSNEFISYTIPYLLAFYGADWSSINNLLSLLLFLSVIFVLSLRSGIIFINPLLSIIGYSLFQVTYSYLNQEKKLYFYLRKNRNRIR